MGQGASRAHPDQRHQRPRPPACGGRERKRKAGGLRDGLVAGRESRGGPSWRSPMAKAPQKLVLSGSRDIPFDRLHLSQSNVRRVKAGVSIGELAEDIVRRKLPTRLNVRPLLDTHGEERPEGGGGREE